MLDVLFFDWLTFCIPQADWLICDPSCNWAGFQCQRSYPWMVGVQRVLIVERVRNAYEIWQLDMSAEY